MTLAEQVADLERTVAGLLSRVRTLELVTRPRPRDGGMFVDEDD